MGNPSRHFASGLEDECPGARRGHLQETVLTIIHLGKMTYISQVTAKQGQVMAFIPTAQAAQGISCRPIVQTRYHCITEIGGYGHQAAVVQQLTESGSATLRVRVCQAVMDTA